MFQTILFTTDAAILELISANDQSADALVNGEDVEEASSTRANANQPAVSRPSTAEPVSFYRVVMMQLFFSQIDDH